MNPRRRLKEAKIRAKCECLRTKVALDEMMQTSTQAQDAYEKVEVEFVEKIRGGTQE